MAEEDLSRVTIISTSRRVDLALPGSVSLSDLMPSILRFSGLETNAPTEAVNAWVLQRFGSDPFDLYTPIDKLHIRDGETLYLRHREGAIPDAAFDDVVDAVAGATNSRPSWAPRHSQRVGLALMLTVLVGAPLVAIMGALRSENLALAGAAVGSAAFLSFAAFIGAVSLARAARETRTATCLAWGSVALAAITGWFLADLLSQGPTPLALQLILASSLVLATSAGNALAARVHAMPLLSAALAALFTITSSAFMMLFLDKEVEVAGITMTSMAFLTTFLPTLSYRIAGIALPNLPVTTEAMLADETPVQSDIVERAVLADRLLGAMLISSTISAVLSSLIVIRQGTIWATVLVLCLGLAFLLRARAFVGLTQRLGLLLGGAILTIVGVLALALSSSSSSSVLGVVLLFGCGLPLTYLFAHYSARTYNRVLSPTWGRWGDIFEWLAIMGIVPALLGVLDLYAYFGAMFAR